MSSSNWMKIAEGYAEWLFDEGLTGIDESDSLAEAKIRIAKRVAIPKAWVGAKQLHIVPVIPEGIGTRTGNTEDVIGYRLMTVLIWPSNSNEVDDIDAWMNWREVVRNSVLPLTDGAFGIVDPPIVGVEWEPLAIYDQAAFAAQYDVQGFTLRAWVHEHRQTRSL